MTSALQELLQLTDYAVGVEQLSANGHVFVDAQMVVSLSNSQLKLQALVYDIRPPSTATIDRLCRRPRKTVS